MKTKKYLLFATGLLAGCLLMISATTFAESAKQYILGVPSYVIHVNGALYESDDLPIMNYKNSVGGHTYIPMRAVGDILGASVEWNEAERIAEINFGTAVNQNSAFRNLHAVGSDGSYKVIGEARVFEANMSYAVSDGHHYILENFHTLDEGAPEWSAFNLDIEIPQDKIPVNGTLTLEVFEYSAKDGSKINILTIQLESFQ